MKNTTDDGRADKEDSKRPTNEELAETGVPGIGPWLDDDDDDYRTTPISGRLADGTPYDI